MSWVTLNSIRHGTLAWFFNIDWNFYYGFFLCVWVWKQEKKAATERIGFNQSKSSKEHRIVDDFFDKTFIRTFQWIRLLWTFTRNFKCLTNSHLGLFFHHPYIKVLIFLSQKNIVSYYFFSLIFFPLVQCSLLLFCILPNSKAIMGSMASIITKLQHKCTNSRTETKPKRAEETDRDEDRRTKKNVQASAIACVFATVIIFMFGVHPRRAIMFKHKYF